MKRTLLACVIGINCVSIAQATTIKQSIEKAISSNPRVLSQHYAVMADQHFIRQMQGQYWPSVDVTGGYGPEYANNTSTRGSAKGGSTQLDRQEGDIAIQEILYDGGKRSSQVDQKKAIKNYDGSNLTETKESVALSTAEAYINVLREQSVVDIYEAAIANDEQKVTNIEKGLDSGSNKASDAQLTRSMLALNKTRLSEAQTRLSEAANFYEQLVGEKPTKTMQKPMLPKSMPKTIEQAWDQGKVDNPGVLASGDQIENAKAKLRETKADYYPELTLDLDASIGSQLDGVQGVNKDYSATVNMSYNLFAGGADVAEAQGYTDQLSQANYNHDETLRRVKNSVDDAFTRLQNANDLVTELKVRERENKAVVESFSKEFQVGHKNLIDVFIAENDHIAAQVELTNAQYAQYIDSYALLASMGHLVDFISLNKVSDVRKV